MTFVAAIAALTLLQPAPAAPPAPQYSVVWAVNAAQADMATLPPERRPYVRYLYCFDGSKQTWAAVSMALNTALSRSPFGVTPLDLHNGRLIRLNLAELALSEEHAKNLHAVYDSLIDQDPYFHHLDWKIENPKTVYTNWKGEKFSGRYVRFCTGAQPAIAVAYEQLKLETHCEAPLLVAEQFVIKSLSTINGGKYYQFRGLRRLDGTAVFTLDQYLKDRGYDRAAAEKLGALDRVAILFSGVTGKERAAEFFKGSGVAPSRGSGIGSVTFDVSEGQRRAANSPFQNLLKSEFAASESIIEIANGYNEFALWNAQGELQDEVPANGDGAIAVDGTIPHPYVPRLNPAVSCIRCHGPHDGWQPVKNDVQEVLATGRIRVAGDLAAGEKAVDDETLNKLRGMYGGNLLFPLNAARNSYADAVFRQSGKMSIPEASDAMAGVFTRIDYSQVSPEKACQELGLSVPQGIKPERVIAAALPPKPLGDELFETLRQGRTLPRASWERIYGEALSRAVASGAVK